jgi:hypothetical protein
LFVQTLREYIVFKLKASKITFNHFFIEYGEHYISAAQNRGPPDQMRTDANKGPVSIKIGDNPDVQWDLQVLISIFHDHHDSLFGKTYSPLIICLVEDFIPTVKAKTLLLSIRDIRNKRAHDSPITAREVYRLADLT